MPEIQAYLISKILKLFTSAKKAAKTQKGGIVSRMPTNQLQETAGNTKVVHILTETINQITTVM